MNINEIFESFQGEGPNTGKPSIFIRFSGCNLKCIYCDTKYTWLFGEKTLLNIRDSIPLEFHDKLGNEFYQKKDETHKMTIIDLIGNIKQYSATNIVITGGEPLLQKKEIENILLHPYFENFNFEIETNGTIEPIELPTNKLQYNVSPKLANSFNKLENRYIPSVLNKFKQKNSVFKFVVNESDDITEIIKIQKELNIPGSQIYLMPEAISKEQLDKNGKMVAELAMLYNYNYSHRLHIQFYDDKRGV
ncbi:MAG: 7-carboxy-7-deazaguanine synthase [Candidatus Heimdallarchaeota archaeon LC_2]|nr:MAG: 7-carboxy-7-deazaguanine synthase [Candidatus Heimdallarchaeota archaeon LC_2]